MFRHIEDFVGVASDIPRRTNLSANFLIPWLLYSFSPFSSNVPYALGTEVAL